MERDEGDGDTYGGARGSSSASFSIFAGKTLRGGRIIEDEAAGHHQKGETKTGRKSSCMTGIFNATEAERSERDSEERPKEQGRHLFHL